MFMSSLFPQYITAVGPSVLGAGHSPREFTRVNAGNVMLHTLLKLAET